MTDIHPPTEGRVRPVHWHDDPQKSPYDYFKEMCRYTGADLPRHLFHPSDHLTRLVEKLADVQDEVARLRSSGGARVEPVLWRLRNTGFRNQPHYCYYNTREKAEREQQQFNMSCDDASLVELTALYEHPISVSPEPSEILPADLRETYDFAMEIPGLPGERIRKLVRDYNRLRQSPGEPSGGVDVMAENERLEQELTQAKAIIELLQESFGEPPGEAPFDALENFATWCLGASPEAEGMVEHIIENARAALAHAAEIKVGVRKFVRGTDGNPYRCDNCGELPARHDTANGWTCPPSTKDDAHGR